MIKTNRNVKSLYIPYNYLASASMLSISNYTFQGMNAEQMLFLDRNKMWISENVRQSILHDLGSRPAECGGVLGAGESGVITSWYFDRTGCCSANAYTPDVSTINQVLRKDWKPQNIYMVGIVHSHATGKTVPSCGDINYAIRILRAIETVDAFYLPIVELHSTGSTLYSYIVQYDRKGQFQCRKIEENIM